MIDAPTLSILLMTALCVLAHFQPNAPRTYAAACFAFYPALHGITAWDVDGFSYYLSAALFNLLTIILLNLVYPICRTVIQLQRIAFGMILANGFGATLWYGYFEPTLYNWAFVALYAAGCVVLSQGRGSRDVGGFSADSWRRCFRVDRMVRVDFLRKIETETER